MAAKEEQLGRLHQLLTDAYIKELERGEDLSPALLTSISKFLKDNNIDCEGEKDEALQKLKTAAGDNVRQFPFNPAKD